MSVTRDDVDRIAELARLRLEDAEADRLTEEMNRILEHADRLRAEGGGSANGGAGVVGPGLVSEESPGDPDEPTAGTDGRPAISGARAPGPTPPDELESAPADFAPRFEDGFFVVPPPHGVQAE